jgi:hypothetical protein
MTPSGMPMKIISSIAVRTSSKVAGNAAVITG